MKIAVDGGSLPTNRSGIGQYIHNLLREFTRLDQQNEYFISGTNISLKKLHLPSITDEKSYEQAIRALVVKVPFPFKKIVRIVNALYTPIAMRRLGVDLFWGANYLGIFNQSFKTVITIHDMAYHYYPDFIDPKAFIELTRKLHEHAHQAHAIISDSESTKRDIIKFLGVPEKKIRVIYIGVSSQFQAIYQKEVLEKVRQKYRLPDRFILFVGTLEPRKNVLGLIRAFKQLAEDYQFMHDLLIVGGKGWNYREIFEAVDDLGLRKRVNFTGYVSDEDLPALYNLADVFVYPSFYEGFGMPVLEAMASGTPVVTSNVSSLPEVGGDAVLYVNPNQVEEIAISIRRVLSDDRLRQTLRERGLVRSKNFSWERTARQTLKVFEDVIQAK